MYRKKNHTSAKRCILLQLQKRTSRSMTEDLKYQNKGRFKNILSVLPSDEVLPRADIR